ncbi:hypothetical protein [Rhizobium rhizogenes]|uniref:hypothetical protein n=1 Tax=Rhizobium rhizogenes TaxID=359 RepID=UPI0015721BF1|nr:hypothetical protein [Rhizobium rhizogenes]NTF41672.1 hypothetical protein [Rhizobium rhizogenes]
MARILIDVSAAGEDWLKDAVSQLRKNANVTFLYSDHEKYKNEVVRHSFLGPFLKLMKQLGKREDTDPEVCAKIIAQLEKNPTWAGAAECDDPQIFAIVYQKPSAYVFTSDKRLTRCKDCMKDVLDKQHRSFTTIQSRSNYQANEDRIRA